MNTQSTLAGVILAGGRASRMNHTDKGLVLYQGQPLVSYPIATLSALTSPTFINANRNIDRYQDFGLPVITDLSPNFSGPLAGILSAMKATTAESLIVLPCDSPLIKAPQVLKLLTHYRKFSADVAIPFDGERLHPVFLVLKTHLKDSLESYLASGERKVELWLKAQPYITVDFSDEAAIFCNINTLTELSALETRYADQP